MTIYASSSPPTVLLIVIILAFIFAGWGGWMVASRITRRRHLKILLFIVGLVVLIFIFSAVVGIFNYVYTFTQT